LVVRLRHSGSLLSNMMFLGNRIGYVWLFATTRCNRCRGFSRVATSGSTSKVTILVMFVIVRPCPAPAGLARPFW
jgi:hypothetical protein